MVILLTASLVLLFLGLALLIMALRGKPAPAPVTDEGTQPAPRRRMRPVPLVLGLVLFLAGSAGAFWLVAIEGLGSPNPDQWVLQRWPSSRLVARLDAEDPERRRSAGTELLRRYEANELSEDVERRLVNRAVASHIGEPDDPARPAEGRAALRVDLLKAYNKGLIDDTTWGQLVARTAPKSLRLSNRVNPGDPVVMRLSLGMADPSAAGMQNLTDQPAWLLAVVDETYLDGQAIEPPQALVLAPNPAWAPPPETDEPELSIGGPPPSPLTRQVRIEETLLPDGFSSAGTHEFTARLRVYAFDPENTPAPVEAVSATGEAGGRGVPAVITSRLSVAEAEALAGNALGMWEWPITRQIRVAGEEAQAPAPAAAQEAPPAIE